MTGAKVTNEEIEKRRELIRSYMARGVIRPRQLLQQKQLKVLYDVYKSPYRVLRYDIETVQKENSKVLAVISGDEVLGDYRVGIQELITKTWAELDNITCTDNPIGVNLLIKTLADLYKDYARSMGVDVDKLDPQQIINLKKGYNQDTGVEGTINTMNNLFPRIEKSIWTTQKLGLLLQNLSKKSEHALNKKTF